MRNILQKHSMTHTTLTKDQIINFILNNVDEIQRTSIIKTIHEDALSKELFLSEKRKFDVERYLDNEMNIGEICEIEELFKINESLFEYFELSNDVNNFLETVNLKDQLNTIHQELYGSGANQQKSKQEVTDSRIIPVKKLVGRNMAIRKWIAAASIIIFISVFSLNYLTKNQYSLEERLYNSYYEPFQNNTNSFFKSSTLIEAKKKYSNQEYDVAWMLIDNLPVSVTIEAEKTLYAGLTLMELERYPEAVKKFKSLQADEEHTVINSIGQWYLALCYLKTERKADAKDVLKIIVANKSYNHNEAKKILKKLS